MPMRIHATTLALLCLAPAINPSVQAAGQPPAVVTELVTRAKQQVTLIDMKAFRVVVSGLAEHPQRTLIIDVREPDEFSTGHIPGAINIPRGVIEFRIWSHLGYPERTGTDIELYLYCGWGSRAALAASTLQQLGLSRVIAVDMQLEDWRTAGLPFTVP
jgi:rhodanese-related sulfurtransferase